MTSTTETTSPAMAEATRMVNTHPVFAALSETAKAEAAKGLAAKLEKGSLK